MLAFQVKDYGAARDGVTLDTAAIQAAIDACNEAGGGEVVLDNGVFLTGTLVVRSFVTLLIKENALLLGSSRFEDYKSDITPFVDAVGQERGRCLLFIENAEQVTIAGGGVIHGRGDAFLDDHPQFSQRPFLLRVVGSKNVTLHTITIRNSPAWNVHFLECEHVRVHNTQIISRVGEHQNNDGIDIDGCRDVEITGCYIDTGDDGICLKTTTHKPCEHIRISDCTVSSRWAAFKIGTESIGDFRDIEVKDCRFFDTRGCGIKIVPVDGAHVENVRIQNIVMSNCTGPIFISLGERMRTYFSGDVPREIGSLKNVTISGIRADVIDAKGVELEGKPWGNARGCVVISGIPMQKIENVVIENFDFIMPGGGTEVEAERVDIPEMGKQYPEFHRFGVLPSSGFFVRHAKGVTLRQGKLQLKKSDARPVVRSVNVEDLTIVDVEKVE